MAAVGRREVDYDNGLRDKGIYVGVTHAKVHIFDHESFRSCLTLSCA
jgi:hypothetical protein